MNDRVTIRGVAHLYGMIASHPESTFRVEPKGFRLGRNIALCFNHDERRRFATSYTGDLSVFHDARALCFEARLPIDQATWSIIDGVRHGVFAECSIGCGDDRTSRHSTTGDGRALEIMQFADLAEISICPTGTAATPGTACWLADDEESWAASSAVCANARAAWEACFAARTVARQKFQALRDAGRSSPTGSASRTPSHWSRHSPEQRALNRRLLALIDSPEWRWGVEQQRQAAAAMRGTQR